MTTDNPYGRNSVHILPPGHQPGAGDEPRFNSSVGMGRRPTHYVTTPQERRDAGLPSQEMTTGGDLNRVRRLDAEGKSLGVRSAPTAEPFTFMDPTGNFPISREPTVKDTVVVPRLGTLRVREALALGVLKSTDLQAQVANPQAELERLRQERQERAATEGQPGAAKVDAATDAALHASYVETATQLDKAITAAGGSTEAVLDALAKGETDEGVKRLAAKVADQLGGVENFQAAVESLTLRIYDAVDRALPANVDLDAVMDVLEAPEHARRYGQAYVAYLRAGDATLLRAFAQEVARGLGR